MFTGAGGLDLGFERAGFQIAWQIEIDSYRLELLHRHWPNVPKYHDVREVTGHELEPVDAIIGGAPCQPVSIAGRKLAQADTRWLWPEFARLVRILRPRWVLLENVPGLLKRGMGDVLADLSTLGYDAEWQSISAAAFGAPHLRYRIFVVAYPGGAGLEGSRVFLQPPQRARYWQENQPPVCRVDDGVSPRLVREQLRAAGDAVVPQVAEWLAHRILAVDRLARAGVSS